MCFALYPVWDWTGDQYQNGEWLRSWANEVYYVCRIGRISLFVQLSAVE